MNKNTQNPSQTQNPKDNRITNEDNRITNEQPKQDKFRGSEDENLDKENVDPEIELPRVKPSTTEEQMPKDRNKA
jgi:hypothetical protein